MVGLRSLKDLYPGLIAENLGRADLPGGPVEARPSRSAGPPGPGAPTWPGRSTRAGSTTRPSGGASPTSCARSIEPGETVLLPAVVGLARAGEAWDDLQELLGAPVAEVPTVPPCVPGMRLQRALTDALARGRGAAGDRAGRRGARGRPRAAWRA